VPGAAAKPELVTVLPLGTPVNPYRRDYDPWDEWIYEHAVTSTDPAIENYFRGQGGRSNVVLSAYVDSSGFLVPQRLAEQRRLHTQATGDGNQLVYLPNWTHVLFAAGTIDPALLADYQGAMFSLRAEYTLTIPEWLAARPPAWSLILPPEAGPHAGEVIMFGKPGRDQDFALPRGDVRPPSSRSIFYRYSPAGKLLGQTEVGQQWWELYTTNPATPRGPASTSFYTIFEAAGLVSVTDVRTGKLAWMMDFSGKRIADIRHPGLRDLNHWLGLTAAEVKAIHAQQHTLPDAARPKTRTKPKAKPSPPLGGAAGG
jgi:hypothetical protein